MSRSSSPGIVGAVSIAGGFSFSFTLLAVLNIVDAKALQHAGAWPALAGFCSAVFGGVVGGGLWR
jgi:hypothetical protein